MRQILAFLTRRRSLAGLALGVLAGSGTGLIFVSLREALSRTPPMGLREFGAVSRPVHRDSRLSARVGKAALPPYRGAAAGAAAELRAPDRGDAVAQAGTARQPPRSGRLHRGHSPRWCGRCARSASSRTTW